MDAMFANGTVEARISGDGPPLVLLHSLLADRSSFDGVVGALAQRFRVMLPALPGFGRSPAVPGGLADVADRMAAAIQDFAGGAPVRLLGNGYGGFVALQAVIRHPALAERLVLADAGAAFSEPGRAAPPPRGWRQSPTPRCAACSRPISTPPTPRWSWNGA